MEIKLVIPYLKRLNYYSFQEQIKPINNSKFKQLFLVFLKQKHYFHELGQVYNFTNQLSLYCQYLLIFIILLHSR